MKREPPRTNAADERKRPEKMRQKPAGGTPPKSLKALKPAAEDKKALAETKEAHLNLIKANPSNRSKFEGVAKLLSEGADIQ
jgi:hypothetical protein